MVSVPPSGMASRALAARFMTICSICTGSAFILPRSFTGRKHQLNVFANQAWQHGCDFTDDRIQIEDLQHLHLLAAKRQQLASQVGRAAGRGHDLSHVSTEGVLRSQRVEHEFGISADHQEQIIEVVRDPASQSADGIHFLRLLQFRFQLAPLGDIPCRWI